jgi:hypothetical protein
MVKKRESNHPNNVSQISALFLCQRSCFDRRRVRLFLS